MQIAQAVVAGCRRRLLTDQQPALGALRDGFTFGGRIDLGLQLAQHQNDELLLMLQGKATLSLCDILDCFDWSEPHSSPAVSYFRELLADSDSLEVSRRFLLLRWCTGRSVLPICGLERKVRLILDDTDNGGSPDRRFPNPHTCTYEIDLPSYSSTVVLKEQLCRALDDFEADPSFQDL